MSNQPNPKRSKGSQKSVGNRFARILQLDPIQKSAIDAMLVVDGVSPRKLARILQIEWEIFTDIQYATLVKQLQRYREVLLEPKIDNHMSKATSKATYYANARNFNKSLDSISQLEKLCRLQLERIDSAVQREKNLPSGALLGQLNKEIAEGRQLLRGLIDVQMQVGMIRRAPREIVGTLSLEQSPGELEFEANLNHANELRELTAKALKILQAEDVEEGDFIEVEGGESDHESG